jgi:hypothetical protein
VYARRFSGAAAIAVAAILGLPASVPFTAVPPAPGPDTATVTVYGRTGSFGAAIDSVPSGQDLARHPVPGWSFPAGLQAGRLAVAADGSVVFGGTEHHSTFGEPTSAEAALGTYDPHTNRYATVSLQTSTGRSRVHNVLGQPAAPSIVDVEPVGDGRAVAFTARPTYAGQDLAINGVWPVFGILTKSAGQWRVANGGGWANQWTGMELRRSDPNISASTCPEHPDAPGLSECRGLGEMATLPRSHDVIVAQYQSRPPPQGSSGALIALRITGPDPIGRFTVKVVAQYAYPAIKDPMTTAPNDYLQVAPRSIVANPASGHGDERFMVGFDVASAEADTVPPVVQEFRYDARAGTIAPVTVPMIPGDRTKYTKSFWGYGATLYDSTGNLWASRVHWLQAGPLAVYAGGPACPINPRRAMDSYTTTADGRTVWGTGCRPDYDILQAERLLGSQGLVEDPVTGDIVSLSLTGMLMPIRPQGSGKHMTFRLGNLIDLGRKLLPLSADGFDDHRMGAIDAKHRLWVSAIHSHTKRPEVKLDQWLYSVQVDDLFDPVPIRVPAVPGVGVTIQAERTLTTTTTHRPGASGTVVVDSDAYFGSCTDSPAPTGCSSYDNSPGNGFALIDNTGFGHLSGAIEYRLQVPAAGRYRVGYRATTFAVTKTAQIRLTADGNTYTTPVSTGGNWKTVWARDLITLPAGVQTIRLDTPTGGGGWALNSFTLQRA